jgi:hypothetical protein
MLCTEMGEGCLRDLAETIKDPIKEPTAIVSRLRLVYGFGFRSCCFCKSRITMSRGLTQLV